MRLIAMESDEARIGLNAVDLLLLCNCINEALQALPDWEFPIRVGGSKEEALGLHSALVELLDRLPEVP